MVKCMQAEKGKTRSSANMRGPGQSVTNLVKRLYGSRQQRHTKLLNKPSHCGLRLHQDRLRLIRDSVVNWVIISKRNVVREQVGK